MDDPDKIELGSSELPEVLRTLAGVLPQFEGESLESQLQTFDAFLAILSPAVRSQLADLLSEAASKTADSVASERIKAAAESIRQGGRAAAAYNHAEAMQAYQESFRRENPVPAPTSDDGVETTEEANGAYESDRSDVDAFREKIKRRAIVMEIGGFRPPENLQTSWFGKVAWGGAGDEWPMRKDGTPMVPLAQLNLTELPFRPPRLDDLDFLTVFIDPDAVIEEMGAWCIRGYSSLGELVPLQAPENMKSEIKALPMRSRVIAEDYPVYEDVVDQIPEEIGDDYTNEFENVSGFKLGGWPTLIQSEISWEPSDAHQAKPEFVFQIDSTEKGCWQWGDGGVGYIGRGTASGDEDLWFLVSQFY